MAKASFTGVLVIKSRKPVPYGQELPSIGITVKAFNVAKSRSDIVEFHLLHKECLSPLKNMRVCTKCEKPIPDDLQIKGYRENEQWYTVSEADLAMLKLEPEEGRPIRVEMTVPPNEIDPIWMSQSYFLVPQIDGSEQAATSYSVFARGLGQAKLWATAEYISHGHSHLGVLRPLNQGLVLTTLHYADMLNSMVDIGYELANTKEEKQIRKAVILEAKTFVSEMVGHFDHAAYSDVWVDRVQEFRAKKESQAQYYAPGVSVGRTDPLVANMKKSIEILRRAKKDEKGKGKKRRAS